MGRRTVLVGAGGLGLLAAMALAVATPPWAAPWAVAAEAADTTVVDFEDYPADISGRPAAPPVADHYEETGVVFDGGVRALRFNDDSFPPAPGLPRSGEVVITSCYGAEFCTNHFRMSFPQPLNHLALYVGSRTALISPAQVVLRALGPDGEVVGDVSVTLPSEGLVPADHLLTVTDDAGRITGAEVGWADEGSFLSGLVVDDVSLTQFSPVAELTPSPDRVALSLGDDAEQIEITITNTGNVAFGGLLAVFRPDLASPDHITHVVATQTGCDLGLAPGEACRVSLLVTPVGAGTSAGTVDLSVGPVPGKVARPVLKIPVVLTVVPPMTRSTTATTPTRTTDEATETARPTGGATESPAASSKSDASGGLSDLSSVSLIEPLPLLAAGLGLATLATLLIQALARRGRARRTPHPRAAPPERPRLSIRAGSRRDTVAGPRGPVLTLVAVSPPAVTRVREDPR